MDKTRRRITDIPEDELRKDMAEYAKKYSYSVRAARKYLRGLGMKIDSRGYVSR